MKLSSKSRGHQDAETEASSDRQEAVTTSTGDSPVLDEIRIRAYEIYVERGGQPGHDLDDWIQAERELGSKVGSNS